MSDISVQDALDAAQKARQASHEHQRAHRDSDPADEAIATRGADLRRLADQATAKHDELQRTARTAAATRRRTEKIAEDAGLQGRLRAESQARRDAAAPT
jgi:molecular chaperone GrpE (heat shock protein)